MSEQEIQPNSPVIALVPHEEVIARLRAELPIVPFEDSEAEGVRYTSVLLAKNRDGNYDLMPVYKEPSDAVSVDALSNSEDKPIFEHAAQLYRESSYMNNLSSVEGRWWEGTKSQESVEKNLREVYKVFEGEKSLDILNCSDQDLSESEQASVHKALNAVINFSGGKMFDRVSGITLVSGTDLESGCSGDFNPSSGTIRINMDDVRIAEDGLYARYQPYFKDNDDVSMVEIILAHELGHAMDVRTSDEAKAQGIDIDQYNWGGAGDTVNDFSAFTSKFGWEHKNTEGEDVFDMGLEWRLNEAAEIECREYAPTTYAKTDPLEDYAETFAIMALNGDMTSMPKRQKVIAESIGLANGDSYIGPKQVTLEKVDCANGVYDPRDLKALELKVYVQA